MSKVAKISVQNFENDTQILYNFDKSKGLSKNLQAICHNFSLPKSGIYGLKYIPSKNNAKNHYISENNMNEIKHNDSLKIVFSIKHIIDRILKYIHEQKNECLREIAFKDIAKLCLDSVFIEELAENNNDKEIISVFINDNILSSSEQLGLLKTIKSLFSMGKINDVSQNFLYKTISIIKLCENEEVSCALSLLHKILISVDKVFNSWKEKIISQITIAELNFHLSKAFHSDFKRDIQYNALMLINTLIKLCKDDDARQQIINEMDKEQNREIIFNYVIADGKLNELIEYELFVLQTHLLSLYDKTLNSTINIINEEKVQLPPDDMRKLSILMDIDETDLQDPSLISLEDLTFNSSRNSRISAKSYGSDRISNTLNNDGNISVLTFQALMHYKSCYPKDYHESQIEELIYHEGIYSTSDKIMKMLAQILYIGTQCFDDEKAKFYQPTIFAPNRNPFLFELFAKTMMLLSRTRKEMKASSNKKSGDFSKVIFILKEQIKSALETKSMSFQALILEMSKTSFNVIVEKLQKKEELRTKILIESHPCLQELKKKFLKENEANVYQQRVNVLLKGGYFPKIIANRKTANKIFVRLSKNLKDLLVYDVHDSKIFEKIKIADITHLVIGRNCQHFDLCERQEFAFSVLVNHEQKIKFIASNETTACYWTDALFLLTNRATPEKLSKYYREELLELATMDLRLQLLELQNIAIPNNPPSIPPLPQNIKSDAKPNLTARPKPKPRTSKNHPKMAM